MRKCTKCNIEKNLEDFAVKKSNKSTGRAAKCKKCMNIYLAKWRSDDRLDYHMVYYLPKEHYIGITNQPKQRIADHASKNGRDTTGWRVMFCSKDRYEVRLVENRYHDLGFNGLSLT
jgi:hypothetical protein